jgi:anhydro-N-acetylmuramic acid kinase
MDLWVARHWNCAYDDNGSLASKGRVVPNLLDAMLQHEYFSRPAPKSTGRDLFNEAWLDAQLSGLEVAATGTCNAPQDHDHVLQQRLDVLATLLALTARSIALHLQHAQFTVTQVGVIRSPAATTSFAMFSCAFVTTSAKQLQRGPPCRPPLQVIVCGGGVRNAQLMQQLRHLCNCPVMYWPPTCRSLKPTSSLLFSSSDCVGVDPQAVEAMAFAWLAHAHCRQRPCSAAFRTETSVISHLAAAARQATCRQSLARLDPASWAACIRSKHGSKSRFITEIRRHAVHECSCHCRVTLTDSCAGSPDGSEHSRSCRSATLTIL